MLNCSLRHVDPNLWFTFNRSMCEWTEMVNWSTHSTFLDPTFIDCRQSSKSLSWLFSPGWSVGQVCLPRWQTEVRLILPEDHVVLQESHVASVVAVSKTVDTNSNTKYWFSYITITAHNPVCRTVERVWSQDVHSPSLGTPPRKMWNHLFRRQPSRSYRWVMVECIVAGSRA